MRLPIARESAGVRASVTPLIDLVFQLLIYFLCTASFAMSEMALPATRPPRGADGNPATREIQELGPIRISLTRQSAELHIELNGSAVASSAELRDRLSQLRAVADLPAVLHIGGDVEMEHVVAAYDSCLVAGLHEIRFATPGR